MANIKILPYADQDAALQRQAKLAQLLQEQGSTPQEQQMVSGYVIPNSPLIGLSKMLETYMGKKKEQDVTAKQAELKKQAQSEANSWLERISNAQDPTLAYRETPIMENASDEDRTELQPKMVQQDTDEQRGDMVPAMQRTPFVKPGMSDKEMNLELMRAMSSNNPMMQNAAQMYANLRPKAVQSKFGTSPQTDPSTGKQYVVDEYTGNVHWLNDQSGQPLVAPIVPKAISTQRKTRSYVDAKGNEYTQEYDYDPTSQKETLVGKPYPTKVAPFKMSQGASDMLASLYDAQVPLPSGLSRQPEQQDRVMTALINKHPGLSTDEIANLVRTGKETLTADLASARTIGNIGGKVKIAENEMVPLVANARKASAALPRGKFVPLSSLIQMGEELNSNPALESLKARLLMVDNAYDQLAGRSGTDAEKRKVMRDRLYTAKSPEALEEVFKAMEDEANIAGAATEKAMHKTNSSPAASTAPAASANGFQIMGVRKP